MNRETKKWKGEGIRACRVEIELIGGTAPGYRWSLVGSNGRVLARQVGRSTKASDSERSWRRLVALVTGAKPIPFRREVEGFTASRTPQVRLGRLCGEDVIYAWNLIAANGQPIAEQARWARRPDRAEMSWNTVAMLAPLATIVRIGVRRV